MNKKLHFAPHLVPLVLSGKKTVTWRLWDDKNLSVGDVVEFFESGTEELFAKAKLVEVYEKKMGKLIKADFDGHEVYLDKKEMYKTYAGYYKNPVGPDTIVKIIKFQLI